MLFVIMLDMSVCVAVEEKSVEKPLAEAINVEKFISQGKALLARGDLDNAVESFNGALRMHPANAEAHYYLGIIYMRKNEPKKGLEYLKKSVTLAPNNSLVRMMLALAYERLNMLDDAITQYKTVVSKAPGTEDAIEAEKNLNLVLVRRYAESGQLDAALDLTATLRKNYQNDPRVLHAVGLAYFNFNRLDDAEVIFKQVSQLSPGSATPHFYLARVHERAGKMPLAVEQYKRAVMLEPDSDVAKKSTIRLAMIKASDLQNKQDFPAALKEFLRVLDLDPNEPLAIFNAGTLYRQLKKLDESEAMFKRLAEIAPRNPEVYLRLGALYLEQKKIVESSRMLEKVISLGNDTPQAKQAEAILRDMRATLGDSLLEARRIADQMDGYKDALKANPNDLVAHFNLGVLYARQRMKEEALHEFEEVVRIDPNYVQAHNYIGVIHDDQARYAKAVDAYSKALSLEGNPDEVNKLIPRLQMAAAKQLYAEDQLVVAEAHFDNLLANDPGEVTALFYKALIQSRRGELGEAERSYLKIIAVSPGNLGARSNLAFLYEQSNREEDAIKEYRYIMQNSGTSSLAENAEKRIPMLERRVNGFTYNMGYSLAYDNNSNLSDHRPSFEYISNLSANFTYRYKLTRDLRAGMSFSPAYVIYHYVQSDFLRLDMGPFVVFGPATRNVTLGATRTDMSGLLNEQLVSINDNYYTDILWRFDMPAIFKWLVQPEEQKKTGTLVRVNLSYRDVSNHGNAFFDSEAYSAGGIFSQALGGGRALTLDLSYTDSKNKQPQGRDYAYYGLTAMARLEQSFSTRVSGSMAYSFGYNWYAYPDSLYKFVTGDDRRRATTLNSLTFAMNYELNDKIRAYANYSLQLSDSNLPVQYVLSTEDVIGVGRALGDYTKSLLTVGMTLNF